MHTPSAPPLRPLLLPAAFLLLLITACWAFSAGLGGRMIFDDEPNLQPWQAIGDIHSVRDVLAFASSSPYPPGRPLALASFVIDDQSWTPDIPSLKRTNLALHLLNACLVFWLCLRLMSRLLPRQAPSTQAWLALFAASVWALHPMQVSNVSYIIQRMNLLSTTLELAGLLLFMEGRLHLETHARRALLLCSLGIGLFMPLAVLAKENGLLLCAFALLVEAFCFPPSTQRWWRAWKLAALWLPLLAFVVYCLVTYRGFTVPYPTRNFNAWERLLTQGPVLLEYLDKLLLPRLRGSGLYNDNFPVSHSLLSPPATLLAWALLSALLMLAWRLRTRLPLFSFGVFFYFCGHLMESTLLPLELYFEHRNYLPQLGLWLAVAALASLVPGARLRIALSGAAILLLGLLSLLARQNAALWSNTELQAAVWYRDNPGSLRSTLTYARSLAEQHQADAASTVLARGRQLMPDVLILALGEKYVHCLLQDRPVDFDDLPALARRASYEIASFDSLALMWTTAKANEHVAVQPGHCQPATTAQVAAVYAALLQNPRFTAGRTRGTLYARLAEYAQLQRNLDQTIAYYDLAFASDPQPQYPIQQARMLMSAGLPEAAGDYLQRAQSSLTPHLRMMYPTMGRDLDKLEAQRRQLLQAPARKADTP